MVHIKRNLYRKKKRGRQPSENIKMIWKCKNIYGKQNKAKPRERLENKIEKISKKLEEKDKGFENGREKIK